MALLEKQLVVKRSTITGSGKGLFTKKFIPKGTLIVEYKGRITTWKEAEINEGLNGYLFRVKASHTINAKPWTKALARYANDASGFQKIKGLRNNSIYVIDGLKVYIESTRDIQAGEEILVSYGKEYWTVMKKNIKKAEKEAAAQKK